MKQKVNMKRTSFARPNENCSIHVFKVSLVTTILKYFEQTCIAEHFVLDDNLVGIECFSVHFVGVVLVCKVEKNLQENEKY